MIYHISRGTSTQRSRAKSRLATQARRGQQLIQELVHEPATVTQAVYRFVISLHVCDIVLLLPRASFALFYAYRRPTQSLSALCRELASEQEPSPGPWLTQSRSHPSDSSSHSSSHSSFDRAYEISSRRRTEGSEAARSREIFIIPERQSCCLWRPFPFARRSVLSLWLSPRTQARTINSAREATTWCFPVPFCGHPMTRPYREE